MELVCRWTQEILDRCKEQNIDTGNCLIMFQRDSTYFNGEPISGYTESKDGRWMCVPIYNEEQSDLCGGYVYTPQCFEIKNKMTTYLSNDTMTKLSTIWLLYEP